MISHQASPFSTAARPFPSLRNCGKAHHSFNIVIWDAQSPASSYRAIQSSRYMAASRLASRSRSRSKPGSLPDRGTSVRAPCMHRLCGCYMWSEAALWLLPVFFFQYHLSFPLCFIFQEAFVQLRPPEKSATRLAHTGPGSGPPRKRMPPPPPEAGGTRPQLRPPWPSRPARVPAPGSGLIKNTHQDKMDPV